MDIQLEAGFDIIIMLLYYYVIILQEEKNNRYCMKLNDNVMN